MGNCCTGKPKRKVDENSLHQFRSSSMRTYRSLLRTVDRGLDKPPESSEDIQVRSTPLPVGLRSALRGGSFTKGSISEPGASSSPPNPSFASATVRSTSMFPNTPQQQPAQPSSGATPGGFSPEPTSYYSPQPNAALGRGASFTSATMAPSEYQSPTSFNANVALDPNTSMANSPAGRHVQPAHDVDRSMSPLLTGPPQTTGGAPGGESGGSGGGGAVGGSSIMCVASSVGGNGGSSYTSGDREPFAGSSTDYVSRTPAGALRVQFAPDVAAKPQNEHHNPLSRIAAQQRFRRVSQTRMLYLQPVSNSPNTVTTVTPTGPRQTPGQPPGNGSNSLARTPEHMYGSPTPFSLAKSPGVGQGSLEAAGNTPFVGTGGFGTMGM